MITVIIIIIIISNTITEFLKIAINITFPVILACIC